MGDSLRKQRLETVKGLLRTPTDGPTHKVVTWLKEEHIEGMKAMAELRANDTIEAPSGIRDSSWTWQRPDQAPPGRGQVQPSIRAVHARTMSQNQSTADLLRQLLTADFGGIQWKRQVLLQILRDPKRIEEALQALEGA